jgi:hypothetical protein
MTVTKGLSLRMKKKEEEEEEAEKEEEMKKNKKQEQEQFFISLFPAFSPSSIRLLIYFFLSVLALSFTVCISSGVLNSDVLCIRFILMYYEFI